MKNRNSGDPLALIRKIWEADSLPCPDNGRKMRIAALINERDVIENILYRPGLG